MQLDKLLTAYYPEGPMYCVKCSGCLRLGKMGSASSAAEVVKCCLGSHVFLRVDTANCGE